MIIVRISGGVGNQMFQYACGRALSLHHSQDLLLDLSFFSSQSLRSFRLGEFNINVVEASLAQSERLRGREGLFRKLMNRIGANACRPSTYIKELYSGFFDERLSGVQGDLYLDGYWQNEQYFLAIKDLLVKEFSLCSTLCNIAEGYRLQIENTHAISLHVRRGDYITNLKTNSVHGVCSLEYYRNAIEFIGSRIKDPVFYIFSDDIEWCKTNLAIPFRVVFVENTTSELEDLSLMASCSHHIVANSSFSWWGAWLSNSISGEQIVIAPKNWFVEKEKQAVNIASSQWIKL